MSELVTKPAADVKLIVFACEAGMGSSLMGANQLKKMVKKAKLDIEVIHSPVAQCPPHADVIVTHKSLATQARAKFPHAVVIQFMMFFGDPAVKGLVKTLKDGQDVVSAV